MGHAAFEPNVFAESSPRGHWDRLPDDDPRPFATLAQQGVEFGATHGDGPAVGQGHRAAARIHSRYQGALRDQVCLNK
jgi:hypothetical protein